MIYELSYPSFITIKSQQWHIVYEFDLIPAIYGLDWIGSAKMDPCRTLYTEKNGHNTVHFVTILQALLPFQAEFQVISRLSCTRES